jgi:ATP-dependent Clp protease ATP-binding subunit ClpC
MDGVKVLNSDNRSYGFHKPLKFADVRHDYMLAEGLKRLANIAAFLGFIFLLFAALLTAQLQLESPIFVAGIALRLAGFLVALGVLAFSYRWYANTRVKDRGYHLDADVELSPAAKANGKQISALDVFDDEAKEVLLRAFEYARKAHHAEVTVQHLFLGAMHASSARLAFARLNLSAESLKEPMQRHFLPYEKGKTRYVKEIQEICLRALTLAHESKKERVTAIDLFAACYEASEFLQELFYALDVEEHEIQGLLLWVRQDEELRARHAAFRKAAALKPTGNMNRAYTALATPLVDKLSEDLTAAAVRGHLPILIGRHEEMNSVMRAIEGGGKHVLLIGDDGVGKGAVIEGIAQLMVREAVPSILQDKRLIKLSVPHLISGGNASTEDKLLYALQEIGHAGNIVIVLDHLEQLVDSDADAVSVLVNELQKRYTYVIATTTNAGFSSSIERSSLLSVFSPIHIEPPEEQDGLAILESHLGYIEGTNKVLFTIEAIQALYKYADRYFHDVEMPARAIGLAKEVALDASRKEGDWNRVTKADVAKIVKEKTNIPVDDVSKDEKNTLIHLEERMHGRVVGQEHAVEAVAKALRRARANLRSQNRPIANFLFLGPTGVGKTELAKTTAEVYFGNEEAMIRFDMSEFQDQQAIDRLIGSANETGQLTEAIRKAPFSLLLLDELEKAHPDILNIFLQVMDDGRLTDGTGRTVDFTNVILIATSNAGTSYIQDAIKRGDDIMTVKEQLMETELRTVYRPEFLNRFDDAIVFKPLTEEDVVAIAYLMIEKVKTRLEVKGITFEIEDAAVHELAKQGFDPKFGARPLRRTIQDEVDAKLADLLLSQDVKRRDVIVYKAGGELELKKAASL